MQSFTAEQIETGHLHRRKKRELPRRRRKDSRTTAYEQTIRVPDEHRVFKKSKPLIDPLMADDAARFLQEVEKLPFGYLKVTLLLLLNTGIRPNGRTQGTVLRVHLRVHPFCRSSTAAFPASITIDAWSCPLCSDAREHSLK